MFWTGGMLAALLGVIPALLGGWLAKWVAYLGFTILKFFYYTGDLSQAPFSLWVAQWSEAVGLVTCGLILLGFGFHWTEEVASKVIWPADLIRKRYWQHWLIPLGLLWAMIVLAILPDRAQEWAAKEQNHNHALVFLSQAVDLQRSGNQWALGGGGAIDYFKKALAADPDNQQAKKALKTLLNQALEEAKKACQNEDYPAADDWFARALATGMETGRVNSERDSSYQLVRFILDTRWSSPIRADTDFFKIIAEGPIDIEGVGAKQGFSSFDWGARQRVHSSSETLRLRSAIPTQHPINAKIYVSKWNSIHNPFRGYVSVGVVEIASNGHSTSASSQPQPNQPSARATAPRPTATPRSTPTPWATAAPKPATSTWQLSAPRPPATPWASTTPGPRNFAAVSPTPPVYPGSSSTVQNASANLAPVFPLCKYLARLSAQDHFNSKGRYLPNIPNIQPGDIILQDRINYHRHTHRDSADQDDPLYNAWGANKFIDYFDKGPFFITPQDGEQIMQAEPVVEVAIAQEGIYVRVVQGASRLSQDASPAIPVPTPLPAELKRQVPSAVPAPRSQRAARIVYKVPDLKRLVGQPLDNAWLYGDFQLRDWEGNVGYFRTSLNFIGVGSTRVYVAFPAPVQVSPLARRMMEDPDATEKPALILTKEDPMELLQVVRARDGRLEVTCRYNRPFILNW